MARLSREFPFRDNEVRLRHMATTLRSASTPRLPVRGISGVNWSAPRRMGNEMQNTGARSATNNRQQESIEMAKINDRWPLSHQPRWNSDRSRGWRRNLPGRMTAGWRTNITSRSHRGGCNYHHSAIKGFVFPFLKNKKMEHAVFSWKQNPKPLPRTLKKERTLGDNVLQPG